MTKIMLLGIVCYTASCYTCEMPLPVATQKVVFAFDIHGVLVELNVRMLLKNIIVEWGKAPLLPFYALNDFLHGTYSRQPGERKLANSQTPVEETWNIVRKLHEHNYPLFIFSNIEAPAYCELADQYADHFGLFNGFHVVEPQKNSGNILRKPNKLAYETFKIFLQNHQMTDSLVIMIDDSKENILAAQEAGFYGILFSSPEILAAKLKPFLSQ